MVSGLLKESLCNKNSSDRFTRDIKITSGINLCQVMLVRFGV